MFREGNSEVDGRQTRNPETALERFGGCVPMVASGLSHFFLDIRSVHKKEKTSKNSDALPIEHSHSLLDCSRRGLKCLYSGA